MSRRPHHERFRSQTFGDLAELASERESFRRWVLDQGVADDRVEELAVVFSELGANAVRATDLGSPPPEATATVEGGRILLEVRNCVAPGDEVEIQRWDLTDPLRGGGRGLMIVSALTDDLEVDHDAGWLIVRCEASV